MDMENMESNTTSAHQGEQKIPLKSSKVQFRTKLMFGFSKGDRSAKARLLAISGALVEVLFRL